MSEVPSGAGRTTSPIACEAVAQGAARWRVREFATSLPAIWFGIQTVAAVVSFASCLQTCILSDPPTDVVKIRQYPVMLEVLRVDSAVNGSSTSSHRSRPLSALQQGKAQCLGDALTTLPWSIASLSQLFRRAFPCCTSAFPLGCFLQVCQSTSSCIALARGVSSCDWAEACCRCPAQQHCMAHDAPHCQPESTLLILPVCRFFALDCQHQ